MTTPRWHDPDMTGKGFVVTGFNRISLAMTGLFCLALLAGCEDKPIQITYDRPAEYQIPQTIRRLAVAEFGGQSAQDKKFGNIAADHLASDLDAYNKQYHRYELVDRKRLQAILEERDIQLAVSDTTSAAEAGKLANAEAIIYGSVTTSTRDEQASRMSIDFRSGNPKRVFYTKRYALASVNFTMDDLATGKTLTSVTLTEEYDSDSDEKSKKISKALGFSSDDLPPPDQILTHLIAACVEQFVQKISPHSVTVVEKMEKGKSKIVETGNKLARTGAYDEALQCYRRALEARDDDDGAMFNMGLIYEAKGQFAEADQRYSKAFAIKANEKYILARQRVRRECAE